MKFLAVKVFSRFVKSLESFCSIIFKMGRRATSGSVAEVSNKTFSSSDFNSYNTTGVTVSSSMPIGFSLKILCLTGLNATGLKFLANALSAVDII